MPFKDLQEELNYLQSKAILSDIIEHLENARNFVLFMFITISAIDSSTDRTVDMLLTLRYTIAAALYLKKAWITTVMKRTYHKRRFLSPCQACP